MKAKEIYYQVPQHQENIQLLLASAGSHISKASTAWKTWNFQIWQDLQGRKLGKDFFKCLLSVMWVSRSSGLMRWACFTRLLANTEHEWCFGQWKHRPEAHRNVSVVPDVRILEREERRPPRQCNWQKGEVYYWLKPWPSAASNAVVQVREPRAQAVTQIYRVSTCSWFKRIGYKFAKQFHWSKLLCWWDFSGGFRPIPNFLIGKQQSVLSES